MGWTPLADRLDSLPRVLCGPILRKVTADSVTVWLALRMAAVVSLHVRDEDVEVLEGSRKTTAIGVSLHIVAVTGRAAAQGTVLKSGITYQYDLTFAFEDGAVQTLAAATAPASLAYPPFPLPSFCLPPADVNTLRLITGSCRIPHGEGTDALALLDDLIMQTASNAAVRPHQLLLTGDQIYADDVAASMLVMLTDAEKTLLGWRELLPIPEARGGPMNSSKLQPFTRRGTLEDAGFRSVDLDCQLMSLGEYLAMYLFVWSDVLWSSSMVPRLTDIEATIRANVDPATAQLASSSRRPIVMWPGSAERFVRALNIRKKAIEKEVGRIGTFRADIPRVRRALANIPSYMLLDDHEVTDDWNMTRKICRKMYGSEIGVRVVQNALVAYAICQHWGNAPEQFDDAPGVDVTADPPGLALLRLLQGGTAEDYARASEAICRRVGVHTETAIATRPDNGLFHEPDAIPYHYTVEGRGHQVIFTDTRTWRSFPKTADGRPQLLPKAQLKAQILDTEPTGDRLLLVVLSTNAPPVPPIRAATRHSPLSNTFKFYPDLYEAWEIPSGPFDQLLVTLTDKLPVVGVERHGRVVIVSGDVHFAFATRLVYRSSERLGDQQPQRARMVVAQVVGSSLRKQDADTRGLHRVGYRYGPPLLGRALIPAVRPEGYVGWNRPRGSRLLVGQRVLQAGRGSSSQTIKLDEPTIPLTREGHTVLLSRAPDYRYRFDYLKATSQGTVLSPPPPVPVAPAGAEKKERLAAAKAFHAATGHYRNYDASAKSKREIVGVNNLGELTFHWQQGDDKKVNYTLRWVDRKSPAIVQITTYVVSLDPEDSDFPDIRAGREP
jgi:hypothetical protein